MTVIDLLSDDSFLRFCRNENTEDVARWEEFIRLNPDGAELVQEARSSYEELLFALAYNDRLEQSEMLVSRIKEMDHDVQHPAHDDQLPTQKLSWKSLLVYLSAAAAAVLIFFTVYQMADSVQKEQTEQNFTANSGEKKMIQLPDGTAVTINAESTIKIGKEFGVQSRDLYLEGEAYFDVKHNERLPFIVHTAEMDVRALGTSFNVKAYRSDQLSEAALIQGSVEVTFKNAEGQKLVLKPNEKVQVKKKDANRDQAVRLELAKAKPEILLQPIRLSEEGDIREVAWKENKLVFENETLENIAPLLERWYGIKVEFMNEETRKYRFTGSYEKEKLQVVLEVLKESRNFNYVIQPGNSSLVSIYK